MGSITSKPASFNSAVIPSDEPAMQFNTIVDVTIDAGLSWTAEQQNVSGFWNANLEANACMEAQWIMALHFLDIDAPEKTAGFAQAILDRQLEDGSWEIYYDAPMGDGNSTIECYAALRIAGYDPNSEALTKARNWIFNKRALSQARVFTRYWLSLIGEWPWHSVPNIPTEIIYFPKWFPFNIYNFASWARATILPVALLSVMRVAKPLPPEKRLDELFPDGRESFDFSLPKPKGYGWSAFFYQTDRVLHFLQSKGLTPWRKAANKRVINWMLEHQDDDGVWGGIQPPWIYGIMSLHTHGYPLEHPVLDKGLKALDSYWTYKIGDGLYVQSCESPVWDTLLTLLAVYECDAGEKLSAPVNKAIDWILSNENRTHGDWHQQTPNVEPSGWAFERANSMYPDVDDTAVAILALNGLAKHYHDPEAIQNAITRAKNWVLAMQSKNGGWGAFDRDNDKTLLTKIPFSDFGEMLDPPSVDVTAHVVEALISIREQDPRIPGAIDAAVAYMKSEQEDDGSWFGRWGVNHIYGTGAVLPALAVVGEDMNQDYIKRAANWIVEHQNSDGGWGETCASYMDDSLRGVGVSTASQTAWALLALAAVNNPNLDTSIEKGVSYLNKSQQDGTWDEKQYTGTGFPGYGVGSRLNQEDQKRRIELLQGNELGRGFMLNYNMYRHYFPLIALGRVRQNLKKNSHQTNSHQTKVTACEHH